MEDDTMPTEAVPFAVPRTPWGTHSPDGYFYVNVSYSLSGENTNAFDWGEPDGELENIARQYRGYEGGAGTGFGERDIDYKFFTHIEMLAAVEDMKRAFPKLHINGMHFYRNDQFADL